MSLLAAHLLLIYWHTFKTISTIILESHCSVVCTIVILRTEQKTIQDQVMSQLSQTAACACAVLDVVMWHSSCTLWLTAAGSPLKFSTFHHCSTSPITVQYRWTATTLSHPQQAPSPLTGNSLTLHAAWIHSTADSLDCSNCYQSKCDGPCEFWGSRRTAGFLFTACTK